MKKIFWFLLCFLAIIVSSTSFAQVDKTFLDIENHWAKPYIDTMLRDGSICGYDEEFKPNKNITMAEFLKMLEVQSDIPLVMKGDRWPDWYINTAIKNKLICDEDLSIIHNELTTKDSCRLLANFIDVSKVSTSKNNFSDLSKKEQENILKLVKLEIIDGYKDGTFRENEYVSRAQACKMILKSYDAKMELQKSKKFDIDRSNTNIEKAQSGDIITSRYEIDKNRLYFINNSKYNGSSKLTLNQEYVNDKDVINLVKALVDDNSYVQVRYDTDKLFLNAVNVCYGSRESYVNNGTYIFQVRFYENGRYDVSSSTDSIGLSNHAFARIELDKMWDKLHEYDSDTKASDKNLYKLENAIGALVGNSYKSEIIEYLKEKLKEANSKENDEFEAKILESREFGKYKLDVICNRDSIIEIYFSKNNYV